MNLESRNEPRLDGVGRAEETLRRIAQLPAPDGLADRVKDQLRSAPRSARLFQWPFWIGADATFYGNALRGAAAAAIVCAVAGGGWQIYSHVQVAPMAQTAPVPVPARIGNGGFSSAGAMRTPDSPNGRLLTHALIPGPQASASGTKKKPDPDSPMRHGKKHKKAAPIPQP